MAAKVLTKIQQAELQKIEEQVSNISVPLAFSEELYHLRMHIDMLQSKFKQMIVKDENSEGSDPHTSPDMQ